MQTYLKLCTEYYDLAQHPHAQEAHAFYMYQAQRAHGAILEPMCGTGRFLIPLLQAGFDAEGFDASPFMLNALKKKCSHVGIESPPVWQQFVQDFKAPNNKQYALIFVPYGSWGLITDICQSQQGLHNLYHALKSGGRLFLEIETVASVPDQCGIWHRSVKQRPDGSYIALNTLSSYQPTTQIFTSICRYESIISGHITTETENFQMYLYQYDQIDMMLTAVGFTHIKKYQDHALTPSTHKQAPLLIYECTK